MLAALFVSRSRVEKMGKQQKRDRSNLIALTGAAALLAIAVNFAISAINNKHRKKKGSNVRVNLTASQILKLAESIIKKSKQVHDAVASVPLDKVAYVNVILPLAELEAQQFPLIQSCVFPKWLSAFEDVRKASAEADRKIDAHISMCRKREDIYRVVKALTVTGDGLSTDAKNFTHFLVREFERNGVNLTLSKKEELQRLTANIDELSMQYIRNLDDDCSFLLFTDMELEGLPPEFLKSLEKSKDGKRKIILKSHQILPVLELCKVGSTRRAVAISYGRRCEANVTILEKLIQLRHKLARLLGFANYADYATDVRMAKSSSKVFEFLESLSASLNDLAYRELSMVKALKKKEEGECPFGMEDLPYYVKRVKDQQFRMNFGVIKQYFPINLVLSGIFKICQDLFGLDFKEVEGAEVWHPDVQLFSASDLSSKGLVGYFYLDLYSRVGKYAHTCVIALQNGLLNNGSRQIPVALLVSQFEKKVDGHPGLLQFPEVVNLFHEFGHVIHHICNCASFAKFSGLRLDPDFVEIPALLMENWCYENLSLRLISGFHQDITKPIKDELCKSLKKWRCSFSALKLKQEIFYCLFDQVIHSTENVDISGLFKHLYPKVMVGLPLLEGINPASCFPRTAIGYEATCYSHIWSEVFAADIFALKFHDDIFNLQTGLQFRNKVLAPGGGKDPIEMLSEFLGRDPSIQAFLDSKADTN
ncbi:probable thimet oligopeptidase isoform X2 [Nicotiana tomentosiformis]|uniref:probable thimet oligopeptidase isoform X2 n=1 Tax=Nicotiana tomentosiformis TaxID=4098 RepID=UPI00051C6FEF|nr:probable thimet oligopeptidase isoform X2 [Nicotiana tomentosiformis]